MNKIVLAAVAAASFVFSLEAADVSGTWTLTGDVVGNPVNMRCTFQQDAAKITGTCVGDNGSIPTTGSVDGDTLVFQHSVQSYDLTYTGRIDSAGAVMQGEIAVAGVTGTFSAKKDAAPAAAPKPAASGFSGNWTITGDVVGNAINMKCAFKSDGDKFTGTCTYAGLGESATTGTVAGNKVTFENQVQREQLYDLTYSGTLDAAASAISGDIAVAGVSGTFSGTKDK
jgi:hypothetical protein